MKQNVPQLFPQQIDPAGQRLSVSLHCSLYQTQTTFGSTGGHPFVGLGVHTAGFLRLMQDVPQLFSQQIESAGQGLSIALHWLLYQAQRTNVSIAGQPFTGLGLHLDFCSTHCVPQLSPQQIEPRGHGLSISLHCSLNQMQIIDES